MSPSQDPFGARDRLEAGGRSHVVARLDALGVDLARMPYTVKVLLENVLRNAGREFVGEDEVRALAGWRPGSGARGEVPYLPARVVLQDFTGVPCVVDLAAMRDAMTALGGDPSRINPLVPADLVIDHSVQVDRFGSPTPSRPTWRASTSATASATRCCAGPSRPSPTSGSSLPGPASCTRSTSSTWPTSCSRGRSTASCGPSRTPWWAPTRTPP